MSESAEDRDRQVVPRWRSFAAATEFGELQPLNVRPAAAFPEEMLADVLEDWRREPGMSVAADLVSVAVTVGHPELAQNAAQLVLDSPRSPATAKDLARRCLDLSSKAASPLFFASYGQPDLADVNGYIHASRRRLRDYPQNPVLWTNLSLMYTIAGLPKKAERAMVIALSLAPTNRFVARSACRFFLHIGELDRAHAILKRIDGIKKEPWLLASEIAVADVRGKTSAHMKAAKALLESQNFAPRHLSELGSAVATIEAQHGSLKKSRKLCESALLEPAENAVAQVGWLQRRVDEHVFAALVPASPISSEASAWLSRDAGKWGEALDFATQWQAEQPFSSRPAMLGSHIASTGLDDFGTAERMLQSALISNPNEASLYNNLAFSLAKQDRLVEARVALEQAKMLPAGKSTAVCIAATEGLIDFRSGKTATGRIHYRRSIIGAAAADLTVYEHLATIYLAIEEARAHTVEAMKAMAAADEVVDKLPPAYRETFRKKLNAVRPNPVSV